MTRALWHICIRIYNNVWLPVISWVMNRWWLRGSNKTDQQIAAKMMDIFRNDPELAELHMEVLTYIPDRFDWQSTPIVFMLRNGGDCEDWSAWRRAIYPGGRIYRLYNVALRRGHAVYVLGTVVYDQKIKYDLPEAANDKQALLNLYPEYEEVI